MNPPSWYIPNHLTPHQVFRDPDGALTRLVRAFSAGIILALALVHIIPGERGAWCTP